MGKDNLFSWPKLSTNTKNAFSQLFNEEKDINDTIASLQSCRDELDGYIVENIVLRNKEMKNTFFLYLTEGLLVDFELAVFAYQRTKDKFQLVKQAYDYMKTHKLHR